MLWVTLDEIKETLRRTDTAADSELTRLGDAAEGAISKRLNLSSAADLEAFAVSGQSPPALPADMKAAIALYVEYLYDKDPQAAPLVLGAIDSLIQPYRIEGTGV